MSLKAYVEDLFSLVSVLLGGGKTFRRWSQAEGHWGVLVTGILGTEPFPLFAFPLLWSPVLSSAVCFHRDILCTKGPTPTNVDSAEAEQSKPPSSCCGHFVPQPGSWLRLYLVHTDLISSFSHCYRRHFMISVFLNLLRFLWSTMICSGKWPGCIWENYIYSSIVGRCISVPIHLSPIFLLICLVTNMTEIKILKFLLFLKSVHVCFLGLGMLIFDAPVTT